MKIKQCECCGEMFFADRSTGRCCCRACLVKVNYDMKKLREYPVISLANWKYQVRRVMNALYREYSAEHLNTPRLTDLLENSRWLILIELVSLPYPFWDKLSYEQMDYVAKSWIEPIENLLILPAESMIDTADVARAISACGAMCHRAKEM